MEIPKGSSSDVAPSPDTSTMLCFLISGMMETNCSSSSKWFGSSTQITSALPM